MALSSLSKGTVDDMLRLPRKVTLKHGLQVHLEFAKDFHLAEMFELVRRAAWSTKGLDVHTFSTMEGFVREVHFAQDTGSVVNAADTTGKIIGLVLISATTFGRGRVRQYSRCLPVVDPKIQNSGLGEKLALMYMATSIARGYEGGVGRFAATNEVWLKKGLKTTNGHFVGNIPNNINIPGVGLVEDRIVLSLFGRGSIYAKMGKEDVESLAHKRSFREEIKGLVGPAVHFHLQSIILQDATPAEEPKIFSLLHSAAESGDMFSVDEFPTKEIFKDSFIRGRRLVCVKRTTDGVVIGACVVGPSLWSRVYQNPPNAMYHVYLVPEHRSAANLSLLIKSLEGFVQECGFTGVVLEEYACPSTPDELLRAQGYTVIACLPKWGYMSGRGWTDCHLFYKDIQQNNKSRL